MNIEEIKDFVYEVRTFGITSNDTKFVQITEYLLSELEKEKEKNKNKDKILRNIRDEFLKYDWKNANPIQTYNQIKSLYESIYCKPYED